MSESPNDTTDDQLKAFMSLTHDQRMFAYVIYQHGPRRGNYDKLKEYEFVNEYVRMDPISNGSVMCSIEPEYIQLFDENFDKCFGDLIEELVNAGF